MARAKSSSSSKSPLPSPKNKSKSPENPKPPNKSNPKTPTAAEHGGKSSGVKGLTKEQEEEDYMRILQAVADFTARNSSIPTPSTMKPVYEAVKGELHQQELTVDQLYNKFRTLKDRYRRILHSGVGPTSSSADRAFFDLSVKAWGDLKRNNHPPFPKEMVEEEMNNVKRTAKKQKVSKEEEEKKKKKKRNDDADDADADDNADDADADDNADDADADEMENDKKRKRNADADDDDDDADADEMENDKEEEKGKEEEEEEEEEEKKKKKKKKDDDVADDHDTDANEMENDKEEENETEKEDGGDDHKFRYLMDQATNYFKLHAVSSMRQLKLGLKFMDKSKAEVLEMKWRKFLDTEVKNEARAHGLNKDLLTALSFYLRKV